MTPEKSSDRVLIVEDDKDILELLNNLLTMEGYEISGAANGEQALQYLRSAPDLPHLILLDLLMPIKDGTQLKVELNTDRTLSEIPVVFMSADSNVETKLKQSVGTKNLVFLKKPLDIEDVLTTVKKYCRPHYH